MRLAPQRLAVQLLLSAAFLAVLFWRIDVIEAIERLGEVNLNWVAVAAVSFVVAHAIGGYRWRLILSHRDGIRLRDIILIFYISRLVNMFLPFRGGDFARIQIASSRFRISRAELAGTVFGVETPLNWLAMFVVLALMLLFVEVPLFPGRIIAAAALALISVFVTAAFVSETWIPGDLTRKPVLRWFPQRPVRFLSDALERFVDGMRSLRTPTRLLKVFAVSLLVFTFEGLVFVFLGQAFGLDIPLYAYAFVLMGPNLVRTLPLTPGDIGPYELVVAEVVSLLGETPGAAGVFAVGSHVLILLWTAVLGLASTWALNLNANDLIRRSAKPEDSNVPQERSA